VALFFERAGVLEVIALAHLDFEGEQRVVGGDRGALSGADAPRIGPLSLGAATALAQVDVTESRTTASLSPIDLQPAIEKPPTSVSYRDAVRCVSSFHATLEGITTSFRSGAPLGSSPREAIRFAFAVSTATLAMFSSCVCLLRVRACMMRSAHRRVPFRRHDGGDDQHSYCFFK
jgi:hypothetical protein